jgi:putative transposase
VLSVLDGAKALRKAARDVLGVHAPVQRCVRHKERNVLDDLPERDQPAAKQRLRRAWALDDHELSANCAHSPVSSSATIPGAAASLCEGLEETPTLQRRGIRGNLKQTLASTNPCESMIECVRRTSRIVKRWQSGDMALRWTAAGMIEAERQFRRVIGYRDLAELAVAIERDLGRTTSPFPTQEVIPVDAWPSTSAPPPAKVSTSGTSVVCFPGGSYFDA